MQKKKVLVSLSLKIPFNKRGGKKYEKTLRLIIITSKVFKENASKASERAKGKK